MATEPTRKKIAILGGGWGAISAALFLTDPSNPNRDRYEITLYQVGWRLGGKGASGRRGSAARIEEHGLHLWMGFYDNSFRAIQQVYDEVQPIYERFPNYKDNPFKSWTDAFKPHNLIVFGENINAQWKLWNINCPANSEVPGKMTRQIRPLDHLNGVLHFLHGTFKTSPLAGKPCPPQHEIFLSRLAGILAPLEIGFQRDMRSVGEIALIAALDVAAKFDIANPVHHSILGQVVGHFLDWLKTKVDESIDGCLDRDDDLRRLYIALELGAVMAIGLLEDGILTHERGLDALDGEDFREWLRRHGASDWALQSGPVRGLYDLVFGYENGEVGRPNFAAGAAIRSILCIALHYKGSIFWKMQAGMGDTIFAPSYLVLKERGVQFKFFHRVKDLVLTQDTLGKPRIGRIDIGIQAHPNQEYQPLVFPKDLPSWPAEPDYSQLREGDQLQLQQINLESFYTTWTDPENISLEAGKDFDLVVLGISIAGLPYITQQLQAANPAFAKMLRDVGTVRTQAFQLWLQKDLAGLGWPGGSPVLDAYVEPMNTWADMSQVLDKELWPDGAVGNISYFCGPMVGGIADPENHRAPEEAQARVYENSLTFAQSFLGFLLSRATPKDNPNGLDFNLLADLKNGTGIERFDRQFFRGNIDPSERYVLSLKGTTDSRLKPGESGFENLFLTGDWTRNGFNAGCIEATTLSGIQAASAISGFPDLSSVSTY